MSFIMSFFYESNVYGALFRLIPTMPLRMDVLLMFIVNSFNKNNLIMQITLQSKKKVTDYFQY